MEDDDFYRQFRKQHPKPHFQFPDIPQIVAISFKRLTPENDNVACHSFLKKLGFPVDSAERLSKEDKFFILPRVGLS